MSDVALAKSVIPIGGHLKHPGTNVAFDAEVITTLDNTMYEVYKSVFGQDPLLWLVHTHNYQGEE